MSIDKQDSIGLAISGGVDSVVLLHLLLENNFNNIVLLHVNYGLRGTESQEDEEFLRKIAHKHKLEILVLDAKNQFTKKTSIQEIARNIRYEWFNKLFKEKKIACVLTAHQQNDVAETLLFNLFRKTGLKGLAGISNREPFFRPLLPFSRNEIEQFALANNISWRNDSSNLKSDYSRNYIRNEVLPVIEKQNQEVVRNIAETAFQIKQENELFQSLIYKLSKKILTTPFPFVQTLNMKEVLSFAHPALFLFHLIEEKGFNREQADEIINAHNNEKSGQIWITKTNKACIAGNTLFIIDNKNTFFNGKLTWKIGQKFNCKSSNFIVSTIEHFEGCESLFLPIELKDKEISLRFWQLSDRIIINQKGNTKKLSDLFSERKSPVLFRNHIPVICIEDKVSWIPHLRTSFGYDSNNENKAGFYVYVKSLIL